MANPDTQFGRPNRHVTVVLAVTFAVILASCDSSDRPNAPSGPVVIVLVTVNAPASLAPGQSAQLTATAVRSDRSTEAVAVQWSSSDSAVVQVDAAGVATAIASGEVTVTATVEGRSGGVTSSPSSNGSTTRVVW